MATRQGIQSDKDYDVTLITSSRVKHYKIKKFLWWERLIEVNL